MKRRALLASLAIAAALAACTSGARRGGRGDANPGAGAGAGDVVLTDQDLAKMDSWVKRKRWILGDNVDISASREYFSPIVSMTERIGYVRRDDADANGEAVTTMTFVGAPEAIDVTTAPRIFIGTGLSVMARHRLTLRLAKTRDTSLPVRIQINASGKASTGVGDDVTQRGAALVMTARIFRGADGAYAFEGN